MSGIVGIVATHNTVPGLLRSLQHMDQASHNSCGLVVHGRQGQTHSPPRLHRHRRAQRASAWIEQMAQSGKPELNGLNGMVGMGHSGQTLSMASHALPHVLPCMSHGPNAHLNSPARVAVVLHGPLQGTDALREALLERDYGFKSNSVAEMLAHLIDATYQDDPVQALHRSMELLQGTVALGVMLHNQPERMFALQRGVRLHAAAGHDLLVWASHAAALPADLTPLTAWPEGKVLEIKAHSNGVTHCVHS